MRLTLSLRIVICRRVNRVSSYRKAPTADFVVSTLLEAKVSVRQLLLPRSLLIVFTLPQPLLLLEIYDRIIDTPVRRASLASCDGAHAIHAVVWCGAQNEQTEQDRVLIFWSVHHLLDHINTQNVRGHRFNSARVDSLWSLVCAAPRSATQAAAGAPSVHSR